MHAHPCGVSAHMPGQFTTHTHTYAGYGVSVARPTTCAMCPLNYFSEGPQLRTSRQAGAALQTINHGRSASNSSRALHALYIAQAPTSAPPPAPAPAAALPRPPAPWLHHTGALQQTNTSTQGPAGLVDGSGQGVGGSLALVAAGSQQRVLQQVSTIFSTPTYNPCTFCGPGCRTDGPGSTSPKQCSEC